MRHRNSTVPAGKYYTINAVEATISSESQSRGEAGVLPRDGRFKRPPQTQLGHK
jgi:hypothetical protein